MGEIVLSVVLLVLLVFHLLALFKWTVIRRPACFLIGCAALVLGMVVTGIFGQIQRRWAMYVTGLLQMAACVVAFGSLVWSMWSGPMTLDALKKDVTATIDEAEGQE